MGQSSDERVLVYNSVSGREDHEHEIRSLAREHGFAVQETADAGDATRLASAATKDGASIVAAAGGDGTINEVVNGLRTGSGLEETTLAVIPAGTGNNTASNLGISTIEDAFEIAETGARRTIDLGVANDRAFINSCVGGLTAEASGETTPDGKREYGILAYVLTTLEQIQSFDPPRIHVELESGTWEGRALLVLVGNCRRFSGTRRAQANVEDGLFEVTIVEDSSPVDLAGDAALERVFGRETEHIVRQRTPSMTVEGLRGERVKYSLDGEMLATERLALETAPQSLTVAVGDEYRSDPD